MADMKYENAPSPDTLAALASLDLLDGAARDALLHIARDADLIDLPADDVIDRAGTRARQLIGVVDGYVRGVDPDGNAVVLAPGEQFGAAELLDCRHHVMTYTTLTPATVVAVFGPAFRAVAARIAGVPDAARLTADIRAAADTFAPVPALAH